MVVKKKGKSQTLVVYRDEINTTDYLADVIGSALGYELTQAYSCAQIVNTAGHYAVKRFKPSDSTLAAEILQLFLDQEVPAELL